MSNMVLLEESEPKSLTAPTKPTKLDVSQPRKPGVFHDVLENMNTDPSVCYNLQFDGKLLKQGLTQHGGDNRDIDCFLNNFDIYIDGIYVRCFVIPQRGRTLTTGKTYISRVVRTLQLNLICWQKKNVIYPQIFHSELTAGVITETLIYFACIFMQK